MGNRTEQNIVLPSGSLGVIDPINYRVDNYSILALVAPNPQLNDLAYTRNSQGTSWLPWTLGGSYYPAGMYWFNGADWISDREAITAQLQHSIDDIERLTYTAVIHSEQPLINQGTDQEPYFIQDVFPNIVNGVWSWLVPYNGDYEVDLSFRNSYNSSGTDFIAQILVDGSEVVSSIRIEPADSGGAGIVANEVSGGVVIGTRNTGTDQRKTNFLQFCFHDLTAGETKTIKVQFAGASSDNEACIYNASLKIRHFVNQNV